MDNQQLVYKDFEVPDAGRIRKVARFVTEKLKDEPGKQRRYALLEFGACRRSLADMLSGETRFDCYGVDIHPKTLSGVSMYVADVNEGFPAMDTTLFDCIFAGEFIEHLHDDAAFVRRCYAALKPGGYYILTVPNLDYSLNRLLSKIGMNLLFCNAPGHYHYYTKETITELVTRAGFEISEIRSSHVLFPAVSAVVPLPALLQRPFGMLFEKLGDVIPSFGAHIILCARKGGSEE